MIEIDRLVLDIPGVDRARAERIAGLLGRSLPTAPALGAGPGTALDNVRIDLPPGTPDDGAIVDALVRALAARIG